MAIPWLVVLQTVPWSEVIRNAPKVAEGAKKLWNTVAGKPDGAGPAQGQSASTAPRDLQPTAALEARISSLEAAVSELHVQMLASSELIKALADQNSQLVARIEANRVHMVWLIWVAAAVAAVAAGLALVVHRGL